MLERGSRLTQYNREQGDRPLVTAGMENLGVSDYINNSDQVVFRNKITIDMFCNCFYHQEEFSCDDNVLVLSLKGQSLTPYIGVFISSIISLDKKRYGYGRQYRQKDFYKHTIKLPITEKGEPNWIYRKLYKTATLQR